jgi:hypothetical protein
LGIAVVRACAGGKEEKGLKPRRQQVQPLANTVLGPVEALEEGRG